MTEYEEQATAGHQLGLEVLMAIEPIVSGKDLAVTIQALVNAATFLAEMNLDWDERRAAKFIKQQSERAARYKRLRERFATT